MTETLRKTGVVAFISRHAANHNGKVAFAAVPEQDEDGYLYIQPVTGTLKYRYCNCKHEFCHGATRAQHKKSPFLN